MDQRRRTRPTHPFRRDSAHGLTINPSQLTFGEGLCIDAFATSRPALVPDVSVDAMRRWPVYAPTIHDAGVRAVFAFPSQVGAIRLGALHVFRTRTGRCPEPKSVRLSPSPSGP